MDQTYLDDYLSKLIRSFSNVLAGDLSVVPYQVVNTTKNSRREKALAYLIEQITFDESAFLASSSKEYLNKFLEVVEYLKNSVKSPEAKISLERSERRIIWDIAKEVPKGTHTCVACGESYTGEDHKCTNQSSINKDRTMSIDKDVDL